MDCQKQIFFSDVRITNYEQSLFYLLYRYLDFMRWTARIKLFVRCIIYKRGALNDPLGQAHSLAISEHCFSFEICF